MTEQRRPGKYPAELRDRAVRMVFEAEQHCDSQWEAICSVAEKLGPTAETVRKWVRRVEVDEGRKPGLTSDERERLKQLECEVRELRRANEILKAASAFFAAELDGPRRTDLALNALEQAIWERNRAGVPLDGLIHHSDRGVQYLAIRYTERLAENGVVASVGSRGDSNDNAMAEAIIGLSTRPNSSATGAHDEASTTSNWPPWNGSTGSTTGGPSTNSAGSHPPNTRRTTTFNSSQANRPRLRRSSLRETRGGSHSTIL